MPSVGVERNSLFFCFLGVASQLSFPVRVGVMKVAIGSRNIKNIIIIIIYDYNHIYIHTIIIIIIKNNKKHFQ